MQQFLDKLIDLGTAAGLKLLYAIIILVVGLKLSSFLVKRFDKSPAYAKLDPSVKSFLKSGAKVLLYVLVFLTAAYVIGIPMTSFMTILASCGLAVGLALQGSLSNLAGGLMILLFKPFKVGDFIEANGEQGTVEAITIFYTILHSPENRVVTIPNGTITSGDVVNYWTLDKARLDIPFCTAYADDIDKTRDVVLAVAAARDNVLADPAPQVLLDKMNESSLDFILRVWVEGKDYWDARFGLAEEVKKALDKNNITIPFPQLDVHQK